MTFARALLLASFSIACGCAGAAEQASPSRDPIGERERLWLRDAANGALRDVFVIRKCDGYFALPRTLVMLRPDGSTVEYLADLHTDSTLDESGYVISGSFVVLNGLRRDVSRKVTLPSPQAPAERRGRLSIERFAGTDSEPPIVLITCRGEYLQLIGSTVQFADEIIAAFIALTGPPDVFAEKTDWRKTK